MQPVFPDYLSVPYDYGFIIHSLTYHCTKKEWSLMDFFIKRDQISSILRIWSHLLKKFLIENFSFFVQCTVVNLVWIRFSFSVHCKVSVRSGSLLLGVEVTQSTHILEDCYLQLVFNSHLFCVLSPKFLVYRCMPLNPFQNTPRSFANKISRNMSFS